jgi:hypothetical protein
LIAFIYVVLGGFHYSAFIRRERVVMGQVVVYKGFARELADSQLKMAEQLWSDATDAKIKEVLDSIVKDKAKDIAKRKGKKLDKEQDTDTDIGRPAHQRSGVGVGASWWEVLKELGKTFIFSLASLCCILLVTLFVFAMFLAQVFFKSLIIWKQSKSFISVLDYKTAVAKIISKIVASLGGIPGIEFLKFLLQLLEVLFNYLADFKIDMSAVGVTCIGAGAPFQLLLDLAVLGIVILVVESELQTFRGLCFQLTLERFGAKMLSREYRLYGLKDKTDFCAVLNFYGVYVLRLLGLLLVQALFYAINFQSVLQFCMSLVQIKPFVASKGLHAYSDTCNQAPGFENADTYLAHSSSYLAFVLILPVVYEVSKILCPKVPPTKAETQSKEKLAEL